MGDEPQLFAAEGEDEDFAIAPAQRGRGKGRGKGPRGAPAKSVHQKTKDARCIVTHCDTNRQSQKVFCPVHARSWRAMEWQAEEQGPAAKARLQELIQKGHEQERGEETYQFSLVNPPDQKFIKKKFYDLCQGNKKKQVETSKTNREKDKPMTKAAFMKHADSILGITEEEATEYWQELFDNPAIDRDNKGFRGREQLWIPLGEERERARKRANLDEVVESSKAMKHNEADVQMLTDHINRQRANMADGFLHDHAEEDRTSVRRKAAPSDKGAAKEVDETTQGQPPRKRKKTFDADKDCTKAFRDNGTEMEKFEVKVTAATISFDKCVKELAAMSEDVKIRIR